MNEQGLLWGTKAYTIGNLQYGSFDHAREWRQYLKVNLEPLGIDILSPLDKPFKNFEREDENLQFKMKEDLNLGNYEKVHQGMKIVRNRDLALCDISTFLIAYIDPNKPTWGSPDEIVTSKRNQKPVFLVLDGGYRNIPLWLASYFRPNWVYEDLDQVISTLVKIDQREIEINNKYWKILS